MLAISGLITLGAMPGTRDHPVTGKTLYLYYHDERHSQTLLIRYLKIDKLRFSFIDHESGKLIEGIAIAPHINQDPEVFGDPETNTNIMGHDFVYKMKSCRIIFKIEDMNQSEKRAIISAARSQCGIENSIKKLMKTPS